MPCYYVADTVQTLYGMPLDILNFEKMPYRHEETYIYR
jgi:hypothetical protein